jgi:hypothetical protein
LALRKVSLCSFGWLDDGAMEKEQRAGAISTTRGELYKHWWWNEQKTLQTAYRRYENIDMNKIEFSLFITYTILLCSSSNYIGDKIPGLGVVDKVGKKKKKKKKKKIF